MSIEPLYLREIVRSALREDISWGDRTTRGVLLDPPMNATGWITRREDRAVAGVDLNSFGAFTYSSMSIEMTIKVAPRKAVNSGGSDEEGD